MGQERLDAVSVDFEPLGHNLRGIIRSTDEFRPADIAGSGLFRFLDGRIEDGIALRADKAVREPMDHGLFIQRNIQSDFRTFGIQGLQAFGLGNRSRETVQNIPIGTIAPGDPFSDEFENQLILHEFAGIHPVFRLQAQGGPVPDGTPEEISRGDPGKSPGRLDEAALGSLAASGRTEEDDPHPRLPLIRLRRMKPS
jgi:hypothetical protein